MTTIQAPLMDFKALPSTPPHEQANGTPNPIGSDPNMHDLPTAGAQASSLEPTSAPFASTTSTPGADFPGAYPRKNEPAADDKRAPGILGTTSHDLQNVISNAGETAKSYLPQVVTSYFAPRPNAACLPEENDKQGASGDEVSTPPITTTTNTVNSGTETYLDDAHNQSTTNNSTLSTDNLSTQAQDGSATSDSSSQSVRAPTPTPDTQSGFTGTNGTGGVGDLPGPQSEAGVAVLPDERNDTKVSGDEQQSPSHEPVINTKPRTHPLAGYGAKWGGVPLSEDHQQALDSDPDRQLNIGNQSHHDSSNSQVLESKEGAMKDDMKRVKERVFGAVVPGHTESPPTALKLNSATTSTKADAGHSPQDVTHGHGRELSDAPSNTSSSTTTTTPHGSKFHEMESTPAGGAQRSRRGSGGNGNGNGHGHRTKIMDKIKGEAKVISGKLGKNEEKVEEGRRLMGKI